MPRPVWSGAISFGLVTMPIKVLPATESHNISFHQYHQADMGRIRYQKVCELDGKVLDQGEIGRGYEVTKDTIVEITDEDLDQMPLPTAKAIDVVAFVPADSIDPIRIADSYYLAADGQVAAKPYTLLRQALERSSKVAVAKFAWHNRERLGLLRVKGDAIVLHSMRWPDEIRMEAMATDDISGFRDHYREALENLLAEKSQGQQPPGAQQPTAAAPVVDLMAALRQSVESARTSRGEVQDEDATVHDMPQRTPKKAATKKATKGTAKGQAKKTTGRKPRSA